MIGPGRLEALTGAASTRCPPPQRRPGQASLDWSAILRRMDLKG